MCQDSGVWVQTLDFPLTRDVPLGKLMSLSELPFPPEKEGGSRIVSFLFFFFLSFIYIYIFFSTAQHGDPVTLIHVYILFSHITCSVISD